MPRGKTLCQDLTSLNIQLVPHWHVCCPRPSNVEWKKDCGLWWLVLGTHWGVPEADWSDGSADINVQQLRLLPGRHNSDTSNARLLPSGICCTHSHTHVLPTVLFSKHAVIGQPVDDHFQIKRVVDADAAPIVSSFQPGSFIVESANFPHLYYLYNIFWVFLSFAFR